MFNKEKAYIRKILAQGKGIYKENEIGDENFFSLIRLSEIDLLHQKVKCYSLV